MVDRIADPWGPRTPYGPGGTWPTRVDMFLAGGVEESAVDRWAQSASVLHSNGDAVDIAVVDGRIVGVRGRAVDRVNRGRLDPKDLYGWQANNSSDRLHRPLVREAGRLVETDWDTAMGRIVARSRELLDGPGGWGRFGFYTSGQLFLEEYYTLAVIGKAGIGTPHMDGNTRLCTATAAAALKASFGTDGQPGSYTDVDHCDAIALWGHNVAETQVVLWMRMLDRRQGPNPPAMLVVDPRPTPVAGEADVHLAVRSGTNLALMNGLQREIIRNGWYDEEYVAAHTLGFDELCRVVDGYPPRRVADICDVLARDVEQAAELLGSSRRLLSTVLQGFYQSNQATAAACQVNNLHLIRGMLGRPGAGVLQMNGQPTAQNTRETGADGDLPGLRNWDNPEHIRELAELWKVDVATIPHPHQTRPVRRGTGSVPYRDRRARRRGPSRGYLGREARHVHQRRSDGAPLGEGGRPARRRTRRPRHLPRLRAADGLPRPQRPAADQVDRSGVGVRGVEGLLEGAALRLQRDHLRQAARRQRHPVAVHRGHARGYRAALHRRAVQHRPRPLRDIRPGPVHRGRVHRR
jgi:anaerobic selenocysteine-containing dehydrogenase